MNKATKIFLLVFFSLLFLGFVLAFTLSGLSGSDANPYADLQRDNGWVINKTQITIDVNKDRSASVVEKYEVGFVEPSYSMYRALPLSQNERYYDVRGSVKQSTSNSYTETGIFSDAGQNLLVLYIDMPRQQTGVFDFEISYKIIPRTDFGNTDRFYMNIVGHGWSTEQSNVSVTMTYPADINPAESKIYSGAFGSTSTLSQNNYSISGNTLQITGVTLDAFCGLTADFVFPKNTFDFYFDYYVLIALAVGLLLLFLVYLIKSTKAKSMPIAQVVNFYPPKDERGIELTPMDVGFLIDNACQPEDVTSMIYYFASKGYLRIKEEDDKNLTLEKAALLPQTAQAYEHAIFGAIFSRGDVVTLSMLESSFPTVVTKSQNLIKSKYAGKILEKSNASLSKLAMIGIWLTASAYGILAYFRIIGQLMLVPLGIIVPILLIRLLGNYIFARYYKFSDKKRPMIFVGYGLSALVLAIISAFLLGGAVMGYTERAIFVALVMAAAAIVPFINKRTESYNKMLGEIIGFKNFLQTTEKDRLEKLISENPAYYYDILPYANVLGVSDVWQNKFKSIQIAAPVYYQSRSNTLFDLMLFNMMFRSSMNRMNTSVVRANQSKAAKIGGGIFKGGGFGGGGFGGGGFGGGGGGRR